MTTTPDPTYDGLLRQFRAQGGLIKSMESALVNLSNTNKKLLLGSTTELESERNTNEILTNENEKLRAHIDNLEWFIVRLIDNHPDIPEWVRQSARNALIGDL